MSKGMGWVHAACLHVIKRYEDKGEWPTTYDIAAYVYQVKPDKDGSLWFTDAQHVAVKRARYVAIWRPPQFALDRNSNTRASAAVPIESSGWALQ